MINENCGLAPFRATGARWQMQQCPMAGGPAVFRARALYALVDDKIMFDDFKICNSAGIQLKKAKDAAGQGMFFKLYPNPANDKATLEYRTEGEDIQFEIYSVTNQKMMEKKLSGSQNQFQFSTSELKPAMYFYYLKNQGNLLTTGKLVIVR